MRKASDIALDNSKFFSEEFDMVKDFQQVFDNKAMTIASIARQGASLLEEECKEYMDAFFIEDGIESSRETIDALLDLKFVAYGRLYRLDFNKDMFKYERVAFEYPISYEVELFKGACYSSDRDKMIQSCCRLIRMCDEELIYSIGSDKAFELFTLVYENNMAKMHNSKDHCLQTIAKLGSDIDFDIELVSNKNKYILIRKADGKIIKPHDHVKVKIEW